MNEKYIYNNDKVVVIDEDGNKKVVNNSSNFNNILVSENIIEKLIYEKNNIQEHLEHLETVKKPDKKKYIIKSFISILSYEFILILFLIVSIMVEIINDAFAFEEVIYVIMCGMMIVPIYEIGRKISKYMIANKKYNEKMSYQMQLYGINKLLTKENKNLHNLQENNYVVREEINNNKVQEVSDLNELIQLRNKIKLIKDTSYKRDKLYKYYKKNLLLSKMQDQYSSDTIQIAKDYFEDTDNKKLVKKKEQFK